MKTLQRRHRILEYLKQTDEPVSAASLAAMFSVSRQVVVGDIALLRASGMEIAATPRGYILPDPTEQKHIHQIACSHELSEMVDELQICVDNGCSVLDVRVDHPVYGELVGKLQLNSRYDVEQFMQKVSANSAHALSELTNGIHLHTLSCPSEAAYERVRARLYEAGYLLTTE